MAYLHTFKGGLFMSGGGSRSTLDESGQFEGMSIQIEVEAAPPVSLVSTRPMPSLSRRCLAVNQALIAGISKVPRVLLASQRTL